MGCLCCGRQSNPTSPQHPEQRTCCGQLGWHFREFRLLYIIISICAMVGGAALVAAGIVMFLDPSNRTTVSKEFDAYVANHNETESAVMRNTTIVTTGGAAVPSAFEQVRFQFVADAKDTKTEYRVFGETYWTAIIARPSSSVLSVTLNLVAQWQGHTIATSNLALPTANLINGSQVLTEACFCIQRTSSLTYELSSNFAACRYPFEAATSHQYDTFAVTPATVRLTLRSGFSPYVTMLQKYGEGDLNNVRDKELLTSSTPYSLIGAGVALVVSGLTFLLIFCCCVSPNPGLPKSLV